MLTKYRYKAIDKNLNLITGEIESKSKNDFKEKIRNRDFELIEFKKIKSHRSRFEENMKY